jgi:hypothetical protein
MAATMDIGRTNQVLRFAIGDSSKTMQAVIKIISDFNHGPKPVLRRKYGGTNMFFLLDSCGTCVGVGLRVEVCTT